MAVGNYNEHIDEINKAMDDIREYNFYSLRLYSFGVQPFNFLNCRIK